MYSFNRLQSGNYSSPSGTRPAGYYRTCGPIGRPIGSFWGRMGNLFPYVGPGASLFGLIRSLGVLLAILYVVAPQYVAGLNPDLVYWLSWSAMILIIFPLLRHMFVIVWSASGILMWLAVVGVLLFSLNHPVESRGPSSFNFPFSIPNPFNLLSYNGVSTGQYRKVPPPPAFQYDRDGNQLRYLNFDDLEAPHQSTRRIVQDPPSSRPSSYVPTWLFADKKSQVKSDTSAWSKELFNWGGISNQTANEIGYDYQALVKKYNPPSRHNEPPSWAVARSDDTFYFRKSHSGGIGDTKEEGIGGQVLNTGQDIASAVEKLAHQTLGK